MKKELVQYHNDLNRIAIGKLNALEQNLLFKILTKIKEYWELSKNTIWIPIDEFRDLDKDYRLNNEDFLNLFNSLKEKFFKLDFTIIYDEKKVINGIEKQVTAEKTTNLFNNMIIYYEKDQADPIFSILSFLGVELEINPTFKYILDNLTKDFTELELKEFIGLSGKYAKTLYRLLKQFRYTGKLTVYSSKWDEFREIMDIPKSYQISDIDKRILKPALKELSAERNLFNEKRPIFENLTYKKIKDPKGRGRGGKVIGIEFYFTREPNRSELQEQIKDLKSLKNQIEPQEPKKQKIEPKFNPITGKNVNWYDVYIGRQFKSKNKFDGGYEICKIMAMNEIGGKVNLSAKNQEYENKFFTMNFQNETHFKNWFEKTKTY